MHRFAKDDFSTRDRPALERFVGHCRDEACRLGQPVIGSISLRVPDLDPLAVLMTIYEPEQPHLFLERPSAGSSVAGAEAVVEGKWEGEGRFEAMRAFVREWRERIYLAGDTDDPDAGPAFFFACTLDPATRDPSLAGATVFLPVWQVFRQQDRCLATASFQVGAETVLEPVVERIWRAGARFHRFEYGGLAAPSALPKTVLNPPEEEGARFRASVSRALELISTTPLQKVVLARTLDLHADQAWRPLETLHLLREWEPSSFAFSFSNSTPVSFIGATPERLLSCRAGSILTEAVAGSAPRGENVSSDSALGQSLIGSEKDRREHALVVRSIVRRLEKLGVEHSEASDPGLLRLSRVQHLRTPITGIQPPGLDFLSILAALHPTPAVGGSPRELALPVIREVEPFPRGLYTGCLGWVMDADRGEAVVAIRTARIEGKQARLYAGAGIVEGSDPEKEERETQVKLRLMLESLQRD